ncbi:MAG: DUF58 domain-containing protein [Saprospiraceae bacterium]
MSFSEVRDYTWGDDVRNIDWNVTARTGDTAIKIFEEERELTVMLMIDVSASTLFGSQKQFKSDLITELAAVIAFSASTNNDKVGAILFSDKIERYLPPKKGKKTILRIIRELLHHESDNSETDLSVALEYLNNIQKKRAIVFLLSDFMTDNYEKALNIAARKHDIVGIHIFDQREKNIPNIGLIREREPETGSERIIDTSYKPYREERKEYFESHERQFKTAFSKSGSDIMSIDTEEDYVKSLLKFFKRRSK